MEFEGIDITAIARMGLILLHLIAVVIAGIGIAFGDYAILMKKKIDVQLLHTSTKIISIALLLLWLTGAAVIWLDTQFDLSLLTTSPKLLAKLTVVSVLSLNGIALHLLVFKKLNSSLVDTRYMAFLLTSLGAISLVSWLYAIFVGLAKPVAPLLGYSGFLGLYGVVAVLGVVLALTVLKHKIATRLLLSLRGRDQGKLEQASA